MASPRHHCTGDTGDYMYIYIYSIMKWNPWFWGPLTSRHLHTIFPKRRFKIKFHVFPSSAMPPGFDGRSGNHFTS